MKKDERGPTSESNLLTKSGATIEISNEPTVTIFTETMNIYWLERILFEPVKRDWM